MHITDKHVKPISDLNLLQRIRLLFDLEIDFQLFDYNSSIVGLGLYSLSMDHVIIVITCFQVSFNKPLQHIDQENIILAHKLEI